MKFSTFAGIATLFSGVLAAPQAGSVAVGSAVVVRAETVHAKRLDITAVVTALEKEVTDTVAEAKTVTSLLEKAVAGDLTAVPKITTELLNINNTLTNVQSLLKGLGLNVASDITSDVGGLLSGLLSAVSGVLSGVLGDLATALGGTATKTTSTTSISTTLSSLESTTTLTSLIGTLLNTVGTLLNSITTAANAGSLGDISTTTGLGTTLEQLLNAVGNLLINLLSGL